MKQGNTVAAGVIIESRIRKKRSGVFVGDYACVLARSINGLPDCALAFAAPCPFCGSLSARHSAALPVCALPSRRVRYTPMCGRRFFSQPPSLQISVRL